MLTRCVVPLASLRSISRRGRLQLNVAFGLRRAGRANPAGQQAPRARSARRSRLADATRRTTTGRRAALAVAPPPQCAVRVRGARTPLVQAARPPPPPRDRPLAKPDGSRCSRCSSRSWRSARRRHCSPAPRVAATWVHGTFMREASRRRTRDWRTGWRRRMRRRTPAPEVPTRSDVGSRSCLGIPKSSSSATSCPAKRPTPCWKPPRRGWSSRLWWTPRQGEWVTSAARAPHRACPRPSHSVDSSRFTH
eukprot:364705-Chlamydomonas_euryale.AAC.11